MYPRMLDRSDNPSLQEWTLFIGVWVSSWGGGGGEYQFKGFYKKMLDTNIYSHLHLRLQHIITSNDIKDQNKTQQENVLAYFDPAPH